MTEQLVVYEISKGLGVITLASPHNHNALSNGLCQGLLASLQKAIEDDSVRMILLRAEGRSFCAGADLKGGGGGAVGKEAGGPRPVFSEALLNLWNCPKPVVGRIQGAAYGGGLGLIAACDLAVCVDSARFSFSEVRLGLTPAIISVFILRKIGLSLAGPLFLSGERFTAEQALAMGLFQRVVPAGALDDVLDKLLGELAQGGPKALQETKKLLRAIPLLDLEQGLDLAHQTNQRLFTSEEGREGMAAFVEKRPPKWTV